MNSTVSTITEDFFTHYPARTYTKGTILIRSGDIPPGAFYIKSGIVRMYLISSHGDEVVVNIFKPHAFFPLSWIINDTANLYFYEVVEDVVLHIAPKEDTLQFLHQNPAVTFDILKRVFIGMDGVLQRMTHLMSGRVYDRLIVELLILAKRFGTQQGTVRLHIKEKDLAAQTGMTRETISREIKHLKDKHLLEFSQETLTIPNISILEAELETTH